MGETTVDWISTYSEWLANFDAEAGPEEVLPGPGPVRPSPSGNRKNKIKVHVTSFREVKFVLEITSKLKII